MRIATLIGKAAMARASARATGFHDARTADHAEEDHRIGLEISAGKLYQLLACGAVSVTDFRCLDGASKHRVRILCLHACAYRLNGGCAAEIAPPRPAKCQP